MLRREEVAEVAEPAPRPLRQCSEGAFEVLRAIVAAQAQRLLRRRRQAPRVVHREADESQPLPERPRHPRRHAVGPLLAVGAEVKDDALRARSEVHEEVGVEAVEQLRVVLALEVAALNPHRRPGHPRRRQSTARLAPVREVDEVRAPTRQRRRRQRRLLC